MQVCRKVRVGGGRPPVREPRAPRSPAGRPPPRCRCCPRGRRGLTQETNRRMVCGCRMKACGSKAPPAFPAPKAPPSMAARGWAGGRRGARRAVPGCAEPNRAAPRRAEPSRAWQPGGDEPRAPAHGDAPRRERAACPSPAPPPPRPPAAHCGDKRGAWGRRVPRARGAGTAGRGTPPVPGQDTQTPGQGWGRCHPWVLLWGPLGPAPHPPTASARPQGAVPSPGLPSRGQGAAGGGPAEAAKIIWGLERLLGGETAGAGPV